MKRTVLFAVALLAAMPLAGCLGLTGDDDDTNDPTDPSQNNTGENMTPVASLTASPKTVWNGDRVTFDARNSTDPDGEITTWVFDFGDGTEFTARNRSDAKVDHEYLEGGVYKATVTVRDDGARKTGALTDAVETKVTVNHRQQIAPGVVLKTPQGNDTATANNRQPFPVNQGADEVRLNVTLQSVAPVGSSEVEISIIDHDGEELAQQGATIGASDTETLELMADLDNTGQHWVEIRAESGSVSFTGEIRVFYDEDTPFKNEADSGNQTLVEA